jgi:hypothetical protein
MTLRRERLNPIAIPRSSSQVREFVVAVLFIPDEHRRHHLGLPAGKLDCSPEFILLITMGARIAAEVGRRVDEIGSTAMLRFCPRTKPYIWRGSSFESSHNLCASILRQSEFFEPWRTISNAAIIHRSKIRTCKLQGARAVLR